MKKLIKRLEELAVEIERLSTENSELRKELLQEENKVFNELDKEDFIKKELNNNFSSGGFVTSTVKEMLFGDFENAKSQDFKKGGDEVEEEEKEVWWLCNKDYYNAFKKNKKYKQIAINEEFITLIDEEGKIFNYYEYQDNFTKIEENKELQEAIEILKDWRFGKCTYSSDEIDRAIETILKHLEK